VTILETQEVAPAHAEERAVFVTDDDRRARRLRRIALAVTVVACLWLVALGLGMFGFGRLPGLPFVKNGGGELAKAPTRASTPGTADAGSLARLDTALAQNARRASGGVGQSANRTSRSRASRSVVQPIAAPPPAAPAQTPVNPGGRERGWARNGNTAPPGQVRKAQQPPPPAHGKGKGQQKKDPALPPPPVPPGQAKKNQPPPPPP
jgi:hypothetical protein